MRSGDDSKRSSTKIEKVLKKSSALFEVKSKGGAQHSFSETERVRRSGDGARSRGGRSARGALIPHALRRLRLPARPPSPSTSTTC